MGIVTGEDMVECYTANDMNRACDETLSHCKLAHLKICEEKDAEISNIKAEVERLRSNYEKIFPKTTS
jgi:hypothetical protein